jgi:hypothetical protein
MKRSIYPILALLAIACTGGKTVHVSVENPSSLERTGEIIEIAAEALKGLPDKGPFILLNGEGKQVPCQLTYDRKVIFPVTVPAGGSAQFTLRSGTPEAHDTLVRGRHYPERLDDIAWENNRIAFRLYGPALQASGERAFGYDVWVKNTSGLVVENRYKQELQHGVTYHADHGNGLDYYSVGPTLGAGASAFMLNDSLVYPRCYTTYEILDNGPLRFTVKLTCAPSRAGSDPNVTETRLLSLDAGSQLNKTTLSFDGLSRTATLATGIVIHEPGDDCQTDPSAAFIACADPADPVNGQLYTGAVFPLTPKELRTAHFSGPEKAERKAAGHLLALSDCQPGTNFTYYWGAGWSKWGFPSSADWYAHLKTFSQKLKTPLLIHVR